MKGQGLALNCLPLQGAFRLKVQAKQCRGAKGKTIFESLRSNKPLGQAVLRHKFKQGLVIILSRWLHCTKLLYLYCGWCKIFMEAERRNL